MNYIMQLNVFYEKASGESLSLKAIGLYMLLLNKNNRLGWIEEFKMTNKVIMSVANCTLHDLRIARNELEEKGYIIYKKGTKGQAGNYKIINLEKEFLKKCNKSSEQNDTNFSLVEKNINKSSEQNSINISLLSEDINKSSEQNDTNFSLVEKNINKSSEQNSINISLLSEDINKSSEKKHVNISLLDNKSSEKNDLFCYTLNKQTNNKQTEKEKNIYKKEIPNDFLKKLDELDENEKGISEDRIREAYLGNVSGLSEAEISKEIKLEKLEEWTKEADKDKYEAGSVININDASPKDINDISMLNDELDRINRVNRVNSENELVRDRELDVDIELEKENEFGINEYDDMNMLATNTPIVYEAKVKYGDSIYLTDQEYRTLKSIYQQYEIDLELGIEILDDYKMSAGKEYKSDFHIMKSWVKKRLLEDKKKALMNENYTGYKATRNVPDYQRNNSNNYNQNNNNNYNSYNQYNQRQDTRKQRSWEDFEKTLPEEWRDFI